LPRVFSVGGGLSDEPSQIVFDYFTDDGIPLFRPSTIPNGKTLQHPIRARFVAGAFLFAPGRFVQEVPYDPDIYFNGEEITLSVRAYTWGYDLFHPQEVLLWHEYTREHRRKHWDDHIESSRVERAWLQRDQSSRERVRNFLTNPWIGSMGCGTKRTVEEYEAYSGISFMHMEAQGYTRKGDEPPNPEAESNWYEEVKAFRLLHNRFKDLLETCLRHLDRVLAGPETHQHPRAMELRQQISLTKERLEHRFRDGKTFDATEMRILERTLPSWSANLPTLDLGV
jgi:Glycosyltransferase (GlcNAc)